MANTRVCKLLTAADFERTLARSAIASTRHFAAHGLNDRPRASARQNPKTELGELSTDGVRELPEIVYNLSRADCDPGSIARRLWLGIVVPKRLARRAATRSLLKRQVRESVSRHAETIPDGIWVVRLRATYLKSQYASAASVALRNAVRTELEDLLASIEGAGNSHETAVT